MPKDIYCFDLSNVVWIKETLSVDYTCDCSMIAGYMDQKELMSNESDEFRPEEPHRASR